MKKRRKAKDPGIQQECGLCRKKDHLTDYKMSKMGEAGFRTLLKQLQFIGTREDDIEHCTQLLAGGQLYAHVECRTMISNAVTAKENEAKKHADITKQDRKRRRISAPDGSEGRPRETLLLLKNLCVLCNESTESHTDPRKAGSLSRNSTKNRVCRIETLEVKDQLVAMAQSRNDAWGIEVLGRLQGINDLVAEEACYHRSCRTAFGRVSQYADKGRPVDAAKQEIYENFCKWFDDNEPDDGVCTMKDLYNKMVSEFSEGGEVYDIRYFKTLLLQDYEETIYVTNQERRVDVVCLKDRMNEILRDHLRDTRADADDPGLEKKILHTAARILKNNVRLMKIDNTKYPSLDQMLTSCSYVPDSLKYFFGHFLNEDLQDIWAQNFVKILRPRVGVMPYQLALAVQLDHKFGSKWLIQRMHYLRICESYEELQNFKWSLLKHRVLKELLEQTARGAAAAEDGAESEGATRSGNEEVQETSDQERTHLDAAADGSVSQDESTDLSVVPQGSISSQDELDTTHTSQEETSQVSSQDDSSQDDITDEDGNGQGISQRQETVSEDVFQVHHGEYTRTGEQFIADNLDITMTSPYGLRAIHAMGRIKVTPGPKDQHAEEQTERKKVLPKEKSKLMKDLEVKLRPYYAKKTDGFTTITFMPITELTAKFGTTKPCHGDTAWMMGWLVKKTIDPDFAHPNWKGFMKSLHRSGCVEKSTIEFLQVIDHKPDDNSTVYTTLMECLKLAKDSPTIITFDLPLWIRATRIVLETNLPVVPRLGGFHQLMSFTGSIGYLMSKSGIEDCIKIIFPDFPVDKILTGKSHYKTLRVHFLIDAALLVHILGGLVTDEQLENCATYINQRKESKDGAYVNTDGISEITKMVEEAFKCLKEGGKTQQLWAQYHDQVQVIRDYIRAERTADAKLYFQCTAAMLPTVMAAGHTQYGKALRFVLEQFLKYDGQIKGFFCHAKHHTVHYNTHTWSGVWSDLTIEQKLMRYCKSSGGLTGGRLRNDSSRKLWLLNLATFTEIHQALEDKQNKADDGHTDLQKRRMLDDWEKLEELVKWFDTAEIQQTDPTKLVSFLTGEVCSDDSVTCHKAHEVGMSMQKELDGQSFVAKVSVKMKCQNFSILTKAPKINKKAVILAPYILFQRMSLAAERSLTVKVSVGFELTPQPVSLFDDEQFMREPNKYKLGQLLKCRSTKEGIDPSETNSCVVIDGGWLVHQVTWQTGQTFADIGSGYVTFIKNIARGRNCMIVFDGYLSSTKDHEHKRRTKSCSGAVQIIIRPNNPCTLSKAKFLSSSTNKEQFIAFLCSLVASDNLQTCVARDDGDTLVVKKALELSNTMAVEVVAEDTDILILLIHHVMQTSNNIYLRTKNGTYSMKDINSNLTEIERKRVLFVHAFSGCDTVSSIFRRSKVALFTKLCKSVDGVNQLFETLLSMDSLQNEVIDAGIELLQFIYGDINDSLSSHRYRRYHAMTTKSMLKPEGLPPTVGAATQHVLRAYLQYHDWVLLSTMTLPPTEYGWTVGADGLFTPIMSLEPIAPDELLKLTACNCKTDCSSLKCGCRSIGAKCISACGVCNGVTCKNVEIGNDEAIDNVNDGSESEDE